MCFLSYFLGDVPKVEAAEKKNDGPAADQNKVSRCSNRVQPYRGNFRGTRWLTSEASME